MKQLPVGIQSFPKLRESNCLYVDKTADCLRLIESGSVLFLSRPRRFGKSLLASTLEEIFKGNKALFEGLAIYDKWDWTRTYPVVRIDWANIAHRTPEIMEEATMHRLATTAEQYGVVLTSKHSVVAFQELIEKLHAKTNTRVVVLVDEYDKPIIDALSTPDFEVFRSFLQDFYGIMNGSDEHLHFVFFIGVSKFAELSVFSGLSNLDDITLN
ncbi:MAG: AAA family ATPase, partial [Puniceicoccales bacterium]|nr:AAA family ATPase [Puniceicoccales bacterium]